MKGKIGVPIFVSLIGIAVGLAGFTFFYAKGYSYLTNNPDACANCHVMQEQHSGWIKSSHHTVAVCNDCHTPPHFLGKYWTKASNGMKHSFYFTFGGYPEPIQIESHSQKITEKACRHCHQEIISAIEKHPGGQQISCIRCHRSVGH